MAFVKDKVALVTGGASGIGLCTVKELLRNGLKGVTIADVESNAGEEVVRSISEEFGINRGIFVKTDVTNQQEVEAAFEKTIETFKNLDIVINSAGILDDHIWEKEIAINLNGTIRTNLLAIEKYLPKFKTGFEGVIVNIASFAGLIGFEAAPIYTATKHGIVGLSKALGTETHYELSKVRILTICPSSTATTIFKGIETKLIGPEYVKVYRKLHDGLRQAYPLQRPDVVAEGILQVIEEGKTGSMWITSSGKTYQVRLPDVTDLLQQ